jgi:hypothetical protein
MQQFQPLGRYLHVQGDHARNVAARSAEAGDKTSVDRVGTEVEHDWNSGGCRPCRQRRRGTTSRDNHAHLTTNQFGRQCRQSIVSALRPPIFDGQVPAIHISSFTQPPVERAQTVRKSVGPFGAEYPNHRHCRLLPSRAIHLGREQRAGAPDQCNELTPVNVEHGGTSSPMHYQRRRPSRALSLRHFQPAAGRPASPWARPELF